MRELNVGMFARSLAGHDKGRLYVVLDTDGDCALLADGRYRTVDHPKKKKRKHLQPDFTVSAELAERIGQQQSLRDEDIRKAIKIKEEGQTCPKQM